MSSTARAIALVLLTVTAAGLLGAWRLDAPSGDGRQDAGETSRIRAWARLKGGAGPSVVPKRVPLADPGELRQVEGLPGYRVYSTRCASCHELPDPAAYPAKRWIGKVDAMREHVRRAGVLPLSDSEVQAVTRFLGAASDSNRK
jgi:hypothetical protein